MPINPGTIHVNKPLSKVAAGYKNNEFVWSMVCPVVPVDKETDVFYTFDDEFMRYHGKVRADGDEAVEVPVFSGSTTTYVCQEHAYKSLVTDRQRNKADDVVKLEQRTTKSLVSKTDLDAEVEVKDLLFTSTNYDNTTTLTSANDWDYDNADGDPLNDVETALETIEQEIGSRDNIVMVVGQEVHKNLKRHPDILDIYKHTRKGIVTKEMLKEAFGVKDYIVGGATMVTSKPGQSTKTKSYIWGKHCALVYVPNDPAMDEPSFAYMFMHKIFGGLTAKVKKYRKEEKNGVYVEVQRSFVAKLTGQKAGYLYVNCVSNS